MLNNKFLTRVVGPGAASVVGGGPEYYTLAGNIAPWRDDFTQAALDTDEWISTVSGSGVTSISSAGIYLSAGYAVFAPQTASAGIMRLTSKRTFAIPFRFAAAVSVDGLSTGMEFIMQVRDTSGISATAVTGNPLYLARWRHVGSAGGTEHSSAVEVQAGSTASAGVTGATAQTFSMSAAAGALAGSASLGYIIDVDYNGITFATHSTNAISLATSAFTTMPPPPFVLAHFPSPQLKHNQKYAVEFLLNLGSSAIETGGGAATGGAASAFMRVWFTEVRQYSPAASLQRPGPLLVYPMVPTAGGGTPTSSALTSMGGYMKWY